MMIADNDVFIWCMLNLYGDNDVLCDDVVCRIRRFGWWLKACMVTDRKYHGLGFFAK